MFVVDEAHMVTAWGDDFRPAFQQIAAARTELLAHNNQKFVTVLMSATLTAYSQDALYALFGLPGPVKQVHAVRLRPEPSYWVKEAANEEERMKWVEDALAHLPRPLILYVTRRRDAEKWQRCLLEAGYRRVGMMHGDTPDDERAQLLDSWNRDKVDIVVATSAFGLGVDKQDVRCVVHATCPEDVDRYYQDVGRGGRDGFASLSVVVWTQADRKLAWSLAIPTFIGVERGSQRWRSMFSAKVASRVPGLHYDVPLDVSPGGNSADIDMSNDENTRWNLRTLLLMARAGLIDIHGSRIEGESGRHLITVGIHDFGHLRDELWEERVGPLRTRLLDANKAAWDSLIELLDAKQCFAMHFQGAYEVRERDVSVVRACGGCPHCRQNREPPSCGRLVPRFSPGEPWPSRTMGAALESLLHGKGFGLVFHDDGDSTSDRVQRLVTWAVGQGVRNLVLPDRVRREWRDLLSRLGRRPLFIHAGLPREAERSQPTMVLAEGMSPPEWARVWAYFVSGDVPTPPALLVLPLGARDPSTGRLLRDTVSSIRKISMEQWQEEFEE